MLPNASEFLAINANLLKIAFGRAFAREIRYMGEQYKVSDFYDLFTKLKGSVKMHEKRANQAAKIDHPANVL